MRGLAHLSTSAIWTRKPISCRDNRSPSSKPVSRVLCLFSIFDRAKIGTRAKTTEEGEGTERNDAFLTNPTILKHSPLTFDAAGNSCLGVLLVICQYGKRSSQEISPHYHQNVRYITSKAIGGLIFGIFEGEFQTSRIAVPN